MKNKIPFELFGEKQELCFTIVGIGELERVMGKPIQQIVKSQDAGVNFCLSALPICLKRINPHLYAEKIQKYLDDGGDIDDIATPIVYAIAANGIMGKVAQNAAMEIYYPAITKAEDEPEKN